MLKRLQEEISDNIRRAELLRDNASADLKPYYLGLIDGLKKSLEVLDWHAQNA